VPVAVQRDLVTGGGDLARKSPKAVDLLPDEKERRGGPGLREQLENRGRPHGMRTVVERKRYSAPLGKSCANA
jgi:hypothetical protein